ncbi:FtsX-like permease family protein [Spirosoma endbachense]|uniref:FtsX-like permease family protein n=1 Tax=Spirosoma endbachense TaxID=2666025 RepID=A0A6P1W7S7_9BACT|nr:FtsX-like permease family protein [Spirosoma endbachense]QHW00433.1 FtsX-like permease family protein [Spirosoma endbachense]
MKFDVLVSSSSLKGLYAENRINDRSQDWKNTNECFTYVLVKEKVNQDQVQTMLTGLVKSNYAGLADFKTFRFIGQKLTDVTPGRITGNPNSYCLPAAGYSVLEFLSLIILILACFNYSSLSVSRALTRSKEIGVRKTTGASRKSLIFQFLSESIITVMFSLAVAVLLLFFITSAFKGLWINTYLNFNLTVNVKVVAIIIGLVLLIGLAAGLYPAFYLSKLNPVGAIKNKPGGAGHSWLKQALSVSQFTVSFFFITTALLLFNQFRHFLDFDYGFQSENIINCKLQGNDYQKVRQAFSTVPGVADLSACDILPSTGEGNGIGLRAIGTQEDYRPFGMIQADTNFINNLTIKLIEGKNLPVSHHVETNGILLNEAAMHELGYYYPAEVIGKVFETDNGKQKAEVVGVVRDFRYKLLVEQDHIGPMVLQNKEEFMYANVKVSSRDQTQTLAGLARKWKQIDPVHSFRYEFYSDQLRSTHSAILDMVSILAFMTLLAIVIACLGLLGMVVYSVERKAKEVGVRKIFGAGNLTILLLLSKGFLKVILISVFVGAPLSYFLNQLWLEKLPNRVAFGWETIVVSTIILSTLGLFTIGSQAIKAAFMNPLKSLRMD